MHHILASKLGSRQETKNTKVLRLIESKAVCAHLFGTSNSWEHWLADLERILQNLPFSLLHRQAAENLSATAWSYQTCNKANAIGTAFANQTQAQVANAHQGW